MQRIVLKAGFFAHLYVLCSLNVCYFKAANSLLYIVDLSVYDIFLYLRYYGERIINYGCGSAGHAVFTFPRRLTGAGFIGLYCICCGHGATLSTPYMSVNNKVSWLLQM